MMMMMMMMMMKTRLIWCRVVDNGFDDCDQFNPGALQKSKWHSELFHLVSSLDNNALMCQLDYKIVILGH